VRSWTKPEENANSVESAQLCAQLGIVAAKKPDIPADQAYTVRSKYEKLAWIWLQVITTSPYSGPQGL
jgi:hypothetical protein